MAQPELIKDIEARVKKSGDTMTGNLIGQYFQGTWLQTSQVSDLGKSPSKIAVIRDDGWLYYRTPSELANDIGLTGNYILKTGDTMTGNLTAPKFIGSLQGNADTATTSERAKTVPYALTSNGTTSTTTAGYTYGVAGVTSGNRIFAKWYVNLNTGNKTLADGMLIEIKIPVAGCSSGDCITIDGTNFHPVVYNTNSIVTTHYGVNTKLLLMYDSSTEANVYGSSTGATATAAAAISGVWRVMNNYDANSNTVPSAYCTTAAATAAKTATCTDYVLLAKSYLHVIIKTANTAASALTFNVNKKGAKPIYINGSASSSSNHTLPAGSYLVYYDGTNYYFRTDGGIQGGSFIGNASTATKATQDGNGSVISSTYLKLSGGTLTGALEITGGTFNYSSIQNGSSNADRNVWFSTSSSRGIPCYNDNFKYNPSTNTLTVGSITGNAATATNATNVNIADDTSSKIYVLGATTTGNTRIYRESSVYMQSNVLYGAAWNDYAEYRSSDPIEPGRVICETGNGTLKLSTERLQPGANVVSDTFGFAIGETENCKTPIAVSGRALVYTYEDRYSYNAGDPVCAAPGGTVSKMSREEVMMYPDRIVGTVSEIPEYEHWGTGNVEVKNRIWIKVK